MGAIERLTTMREVLKGTDIAEELGQITFELLEATDAIVDGDIGKGLEHIGGWTACPRCERTRICSLLEPMCSNCTSELDAILRKEER